MNIIICSTLMACLGSQAFAMTPREEQALITDISNNRPYEGYGWSCPSIDSRGRDSNDLIYQNPRYWVKQGKINLLKQFLERRGNPNRMYPNLLDDNKIKRTPLNQAIIENNIKAIKILLEYKAKLDDDSFVLFEAHCLKPAELKQNDVQERNKATEIFTQLHNADQEHATSTYLASLSERVKELDPKRARQKLREIIVVAHQSNHPIISQLPVDMFGEIEKFL